MGGVAVKLIEAVMQLLRALLVDSNDMQRLRMKALLHARQVECLAVADIMAVPWSLSEKGFDLVVAEISSSTGDSGRSLGRIMKEGDNRRPPPLIVYLDPFQSGAILEVTHAPDGAILIPAPVTEDDLDAALERAFAPWGRSAN